MDNAAHPAPATLWIDLQQIALPADPRSHTPEDLDSLAQDMKLNGQLQEIVVTPKNAEGDSLSPQSTHRNPQFEVIAGVGRVQAARKLGWEKIRAFVREGLSEFDKLHITFSENQEREDVSPLYQARLIKAMMGAGNLNQAEMAQKLGKTQALVNQYLTIGRLDSKVQEIINRFINLGIAHLLQICRLTDPKTQIQLAQEASAQGWSVRELKAKVDKLLKGQKGGKAKSPSIASLQSAIGPDPLQPYWDKIQGGKFDPEIHWGVVYKDTDQGPAWIFTLYDNYTPDERPTAAAAWAARLYGALTGKKTPPRGGDGANPYAVSLSDPVPQLPADLKKEAQEGMQLKRIPKTPDDWKELEAKVNQSPQAAYAWLYGPDHPRAIELAGKTWKDLEVDNPMEVLKNLVETVELLKNDKGLSSASPA